MAALITKKRFTALTSGLGELYFTWGTTTDAAGYTKGVDKLKECIAVHFQDQVTVAARTMDKLKASIFTKNRTSCENVLDEHKLDGQD